MPLVKSPFPISYLLSPVSLSRFTSFKYNKESAESAATADIQKQAHGSQPDGPPPPNINPNTLTSLRLIAFNELFEVAFFSSLLSNISTNTSGYTFSSSSSRDTAVASLTAILAQEVLHVLNANGALSNFKTSPIQPCQYQFPTTTYEGAIELASTFTDLVMGTLQDVSFLLGTDGDSALIRTITSVVGQEGEQNGFFRTTNKKIPSALPFLSGSAREFAFSALNQNFVVSGSCDGPNLATIDLPIYPPLGLVTQNITAKEQMLKFRLDFSNRAGAQGKTMKDQPGMQYKNLTMVYMNQQNLPVVQKIQNLALTSEGLTFETMFPYKQGGFGNGLKIAVLTKEGGNLTSVEGVATSTVFGPALIEIG
ncbi:related to sexual development protein (LsdA) [Rhynchosporium secalis]|uniref:Related to sexual development protein (LsdA) n=1 Tax=Rhynchosporium secalis TaxID=38038 RepID=A0A1E1M6C5_RHYSE|nr:related to sexual development protein (LsdA) [Rhynchosporium secalis]